MLQVSKHECKCSRWKQELQLIRLMKRTVRLMDSIEHVPTCSTKTHPVNRFSVITLPSSSCLCAFVAWLHFLSVLKHTHTNTHALHEGVCSTSRSYVDIPCSFVPVTATSLPRQKCTSEWFCLGWKKAAVSAFTWSVCCSEALRPHSEEHFVVLYGLSLTFISQLQRLDAFVWN